MSSIIGGTLMVAKAIAQPDEQGLNNRQSEL
jgi:hypothetical protein